MHTKNVRMRPVPLWGRCTGSTDFTSRKKNTRKTNGATKQHSMRDQRQLWKSFSSSFASFEFTSELEIVDLALRPFDELSAGQHQKVVLARGLVQEPRILLLDEPTSNLDIHHQLEVTKTLKKLSRDKNILVIMISHDLNIAAKYADNMILLYKGGIFAVGPPKDVITKEALRVVYHVEADIVEYDGRPHVVIRDSFKGEEESDWTLPDRGTPVLELKAGTEE